MLLAGQVGRPHGIAGEVQVLPISDDPRRFDPGSLLVHDGAGELLVERSRRHRDRLLVKFEGIDTRTDAEGLRGALYVAGDHVRELDEDEYWEHEIVGCEVVDPAGRVLGRVTRVVPGAAQDLLAVATEGGERLVPVVAEIVRAVEVQARRVRIDPPAGLLD
ncbi:MAG: ribosome maturation factor RimM [Actinomycetota bacterium]